MIYDVSSEQQLNEYAKCEFLPNCKGIRNSHVKSNSLASCLLKRS